ncbi:C-type lectin domain family 4 member G isoform X2 [Xenopus laevis]|uniref:C-type lectin domain family 4 member G isoform X2 n=1 Tax=Xenopus laevis TaxID=8355 RepID=A0A8J1MPZ0_XENLA|nr:C-type lectin domain family 4 member G isoform X2 [Xenopus laevis]
MANQARFVTFDFDADDYENMENDFAPMPKQGQKVTAAKVPAVTFDGDADDYENMESDVAPPVPMRAKKGKKDKTTKAGDSSPEPARRRIGTEVRARLKSRWWLILLLLILLFFMFLVLATLTGLLFVHYSSISDEIRNLKYLDSQKSLEMEQNEMKKVIKAIQGELDSEKMEQNKMKQEIKNIQEELDSEQNKMKQEIKNIQEELGSCCGTCPLDWLQIGRSCYHLSDEKSTWEKSKAACKSLKALLLIFKDSKEMESLNRILPKNIRYWIGLKRDTQYTWKWLDGTPMTFSNWDRDEPNNSGNKENCVESISGPWNDRNCEESEQYICKSTVNF